MSWEVSPTAPARRSRRPGVVESRRQPSLTEVGGWIGELRCASMGQRWSRADVSMSQLHVLWLLQHHGAMSMSRLAELLDVSLSNATGIIDRMEEQASSSASGCRTTVGSCSSARRPRPAGARSTPTSCAATARDGCCVAGAALSRSASGPSSSQAFRACRRGRRAAESRRTPTTTRQPRDLAALQPSVPAPQPRRKPSDDGIAPDVDEARRRPVARRRIRRSACRTGTKMEILGAVMLGMFLGALDQTIVGPALPTIVSDLHGNELYTWVVTIYLLTSTVTRADLRQAVRPLRPQADPDDRHHALPRRLGAVRPEPGDVAARPVPRHPGPRRRRALPDRAGGHRRPLHARRSAASTRASSAPCSASPSSSARSSAAS